MTSNETSIENLMQSVERRLKQKNLPKIPIPPLSQTLERYLEGMKCILPYSEFQKTKANVEQFLASSEARHLQRLLETYAFQKDNWVTELWLDDMYLRNQVPLPVNSNPAFLFPRQRFDQIDQMMQFAARFIQFALHFKRQIDRQLLSQDTIKVACNCVFTSGEGNTSDKVKQCHRTHLQPLCMQTYQKFFIAYRAPGLEKDTMLINSKSSNYIVIACRNQFFFLSLENGQMPMQTYLIQRLRDIWNYGQNRSPGSGKVGTEPAFPVGLFTTEHRKTWFHVRQNLLKKSINKQSLGCIEKALFIICLDDATRSPNFGGWLSEAQQLARVLHGSVNFSANRWYDKFMNVIIGSDGVCGMLIEHSVSEGITVTRFAEAFLEHWAEYQEQQKVLQSVTRPSAMPLKALNPLKSGQRNCLSMDNVDPPTTPTSISIEIKPSSNDSQESIAELDENDNVIKPNKVEHALNLMSEEVGSCSGGGGGGVINSSNSVVRLQWELDDYDRNRLVEADLHLNSLVDGVDLHVLHFQQFGREWIKHVHFSPDAFIQVALQVTFYKMYGKLTATYESASLRKYLMGRVDNIRSNTLEALILARGICNELPNLTEEHRQQYLEAAIEKQVEVMNYVIAGQGIDNHLLGIREMALRHDSWQSGGGLNSSGTSVTGAGTSSARRTENLPRLFTEYSFKQFVNFQLSTSQVPSNQGIITGYGAVVRNGYGCCYNPKSNEIIFMICSFFGGYNVQTNTYNNYNSNYNCSDDRISRSNLFAVVLEESLLQLQQLALALRKRQKLATKTPESHQIDPKTVHAIDETSSEAVKLAKIQNDH